MSSFVTAQKFEQKSTGRAESPFRQQRKAASSSWAFPILDETVQLMSGLQYPGAERQNPGIGSSAHHLRQRLRHSRAARVTLIYNGIDISRSRGSYQDILLTSDRIEVIKGPTGNAFRHRFCRRRDQYYFQQAARGGPPGGGPFLGFFFLGGPGGEKFFSWGQKAIANFNAYTLGGHLTRNDTVAGPSLPVPIRSSDGYVTNLAPNQDDLMRRNSARRTRFFAGSRPSSDFHPRTILTYTGSATRARRFISAPWPTSAVSRQSLWRGFLRGSHLGSRMGNANSV